MEITLPTIPASLNELFSMNRFARAKYTKERKEMVAWLVKGKPQITEIVDIHYLITSKSKHKKDSSNYTAKAEQDGLVLGGLLKDDNTDFVRKVTYEVQYGAEDKTIIVINKTNIP